MAESKAAKKKRTKLTDLDVDALVQCASYLRAEDIGSLSLTCKYFNHIYYPDSIWLTQFRKHWPWVRVPDSGVREAFYSRHSVLRKFGFSDPWDHVYHREGGPIYHALMDKENFVCSQVNNVVMMRIDPPIRMRGLDTATATTVTGHKKLIALQVLILCRVFPNDVSEVILVLF